MLPIYRKFRPGKSFVQDVNLVGQVCTIIFHYLSFWIGQNISSMDFGQIYASEIFHGEKFFLLLFITEKGESMACLVKVDPETLFNHINDSSLTRDTVKASLGAIYPLQVLCKPEYFIQGSLFWGTLHWDDFSSGLKHRIRQVYTGEFCFHCPALCRMEKTLQNISTQKEILFAAFGCEKECLQCILHGQPRQLMDHVAPQLSQLGHLVSLSNHHFLLFRPLNAVGTNETVSLVALTRNRHGEAIGIAYWKSLRDLLRTSFVQLFHPYVYLQAEKIFPLNALSTTTPGARPKIQFTCIGEEGKKHFVPVSLLHLGQFGESDLRFMKWFAHSPLKQCVVEVEITSVTNEQNSPVGKICRIRRDLSVCDTLKTLTRIVSRRT